MEPKLTYLNNTFDLNDPSAVSILDDLPLWSAPFGLMLLDHLPMKPGITVLDIGFGTGFPLVELAQRLGPTCTVYGIDLWTTAIDRARLKIEGYGLENVHPVEGDAGHMEFEDNTFDLIVSNTGINNFQQPETVLKECRRVSKPGGHLVLTTNPVGHMEEFYILYKEVLEELSLTEYLEPLSHQRNHRLSAEAIRQLLLEANYRVTVTHQQQSIMRFVDGSAFFNHSLIRIGFIDGWKGILPLDSQDRVFSRLEEKMNRVAHQEGEFRVTVPCLYIEAACHKES